jgi:hypothetical protein
MHRQSSLQLWRKDVGRLVMDGPHSYRHVFTPPPIGITADDCRADGFEFHNEHSAYNFVEPSARSIVSIDFSPSLQHQAVLLQGPEDWSGALLWVDGAAVNVPRDAAGSPLCERSAIWLSERFVYARFGLRHHPLLDPSTLDMLGTLRGILVWDIAKRMQHTLVPEPTQAWTDPSLSIQDHSWRVFASREAWASNQPDRVLTLPD